MKLRGVTVVTLFTGLSLLATILNQVVLAYLFGAGSSMDAFLACGAVPFVVLNLAIGDLGYILIPLLMLESASGQVRRAVDATFQAVAAIALVVAALGLLEHRAILRLTTASNMPSATFEIAVSLAPMMWIIIGLTILSSYLTGLHHYHRLFSAAAVTLVLPYLGMTLGALGGAHRWGMRAVVFGWLAGTFLRAVLLYGTLPRPWPRLLHGRPHPATRALLASLLPLGVALLPFVALPMVDVFWASRLPVGSISYLGYSTRLVIAVSSIVVQGFSVVLFPDLSADAREGRLHVLAQKTGSALESIFAWIVPLAALVFLLRVPLMAVFLERGKFTPASSQGVVRVLPLYLLGTIWMALMNIVSRCFFALRDYRTPAWTGVLGLAIYISLSGALIDRYSYLAIGMSYAVFWPMLFFVQTWLLGRSLGPILSRSLFRAFGKILLSAITALGVCAAWESFAGPTAHNGAHLLALTGMFLAVYLFAAVALLRIPQYVMMFRATTNRRQAAMSH